MRKRILLALLLSVICSVAMARGLITNRQNVACTMNGTFVLTNTCNNIYLLTETL